MSKTSNWTSISLALEVPVIPKAFMEGMESTIGPIAKTATYTASSHSYDVVLNISVYGLEHRYSQVA